MQVVISSTFGWGITFGFPSSQGALQFRSSFPYFSLIIHSFGCCYFGDLDLQSMRVALVDNNIIFWPF
uniref:Ubiquitin-60S ribosomal protein L40-like n=1 Tax=Rhizophora mucronata TaxID=61149 RepID=A0A2P2ME56_RHIMU